MKDVGGLKAFMAIIDIIKYEGDNSTFIWKHPKEDFNTLAQLIVHQSQEAVFFVDGKVLDVFGPGSHTLETENIPLIKAFMNIPSGGVSPFHCEVYFINKTEQMAIKWGTDSKVQFMEPTYHFPMEIGASGEMSLRAEDSTKLLLKIVGTESGLTQATLTTYFRASLMTKVKTYLAQTIKERQINIFEIDEHLEILSDDLKARLASDFLDYGVALERFFVMTIVRPDGEPSYEKFKSLHFRQYADVAEAQLQKQVGIIEQETASQKTVIEAQGIAQKRQVEGYTYEKERAFDVAEKMAADEGVGAFSNIGVGLGVMAGAGSEIGKTIGGIVNDAIGGVNATPAQSAAKEETGFCENCGNKLSPGAEFCDECGESVSASSKCLNCGFVFERQGKFCPKCGKPRE